MIPRSSTWIFLYTWTPYIIKTYIYQCCVCDLYMVLHINRIVRSLLSSVPIIFFGTICDSLTFLLDNWVSNTSQMKSNSLRAMLVPFNLLKTKLEKKSRHNFCLRLEVANLLDQNIFFSKKFASETFKDVILQCIIFNDTLNFPFLDQISSFKLNPSNPSKNTRSKTQVNRNSRKIKDNNLVLYKIFWDF